MTSCIACEQFGKNLNAIKSQVEKAAWGKQKDRDWVVQTYVPAAITLIEKIRDHCQTCMEHSDKIIKGAINLRIMSTDFKKEKAEKEKHQFIVNRCYELLAKLEECKYMGAKEYRKACLNVIQNM